MCYKTYYILKHVQPCYQPLIFKYNSNMSSPSKNPQINIEIENAIDAKNAGFQGRSRVSARRAAGMAILDFYDAIGKDIQTTNLFLAIEEFVSDESIPQNLTQSAACFLEKVNSDFKINSNQDLIEQAINLCIFLDQTLSHWSKDGK